MATYNSCSTIPSLAAALCLIFTLSLPHQGSLSLAIHPFQMHHLVERDHEFVGAPSSFHHGRSRSMIASNTTSATEVNALLAFRASISVDPTAALTNWTKEKTATLCSTWKGVACNELGQVTELNVAGLRLNGTIAPQIGDLTHLSYLNCSWNRLWGPIPHQLWRGCRELVSVDLQNNALTGRLSAEVYGMEKLELLRLGINTFSGGLPAVNGSCAALREISLGNASIAGAIPRSLSRCRNLTVLMLQNNNLTGIIPSELGLLKKLSMLALWDNKLEGPIPTSLGNLSQLQYLYLSSNFLTGSIPSELGLLKKLLVLSCWNNKLEGSIPTSLGNLSQLQILYLSQNNLTGSIPPSLGNCTSLMKLNLRTNQLEGPIPSLRRLTNLTFLDICTNRLTGEIPPELGTLPNLAHLSLSLNALTGPFPTQLCNLTHLILLSMFSNSLSFDAAALSCLTRCPSLQYLALEENRIYGSIQALDFTKWPFLNYFKVAGNMLTGGFPPSFGSINSTMQVADFSRNQFSGSFPMGIDGRNLSDLYFFASSGNQLGGAVPSWFGNLKTLQVLDLSSNKLTGGIPLTFQNLDQFKLPPKKLNAYTTNFTYYTTWYPNLDFGTTYMDLSSNALEGELPPELTQLFHLRYLNLSHNKLQGQIWPNVNDFKFLEFLDLSQNSLTGPLPPALPPGLNRFNVSRNDLWGAVPAGNQFGTFPESSFLPGNPELCGAVIHRSCENPQNESEPWVSEYVALPGFVVGAAGGFFMAMVTFLTWAPARAFVLGVESGDQGPRKYGLFTAKM